jgi:hypothetical protein
MAIKIKTPIDLYNAILAFKPDSKTIICHLHKPCVSTPLCLTQPTSEVLDFDGVEKKLATGKRSSQPSCDGVTLSKDNSTFCFVEIKGWQKFVELNISSNGTPISEEDQKIIKTKAAEYNLKGKLEHSIRDCEEITCQRNLFLSVPHVYIIVTDIKEEQDADKDIALNLSLLAGTASIWQICDENMIQQMNTIETSVKKVYSHCHNFDRCLEDIHI